MALVDRPRAVVLLGGDSLFVGDIARPDLAIDCDDGARGIVESVHTQLLGCPMRASPGPGTSAARCAAARDGPEGVLDIGYESAYTDLLGEHDVDRFVERSLASLGLPTSSSTKRTYRAPYASRHSTPTSARGFRGSPISNQEIVLVGRDDEDARRAAQLATAVGVPHIAGRLHGGMTSWREERRAVARIEFWRSRI